MHRRCSTALQPGLANAGSSASDIFISRCASGLGLHMKLVATLLLCIILALHSAVGVDHFMTWAAQYSKTYEVHELDSRRQIFEDNARLVALHNAKNKHFQLALNEYAALTTEEFRALKMGLAARNESRQTKFSHAGVIAADSVDWREAGAVTDVKNQLFCGSCWAYSAVGAVEGVNQIYTGQLISLSEQQLVDCDTKKDMGCSGGLMDNAFKYIISNGGLDTERDYSYWSIDEQCNSVRADRRVVSIDDFEDVPAKSEADLAKAVTVQPISVAICASDLQFYSSGVVDTCCTELDHGVLVVGYGEEHGEKFWIVKNSWGESWGEDGYFRLRKDVAEAAGTCHVAELASYPLKRNPNPHDVPDVCGFFGRSECRAGLACTCTYGLLDLVCLQWGCSESRQAATAAA